eukprot:scaffold19192_cov67-Phaeocystis_antarctica.AAC.5
MSCSRCASPHHASEARVVRLDTSRKLFAHRYTRRTGYTRTGYHTADWVHGDRPRELGRAALRPLRRGVGPAAEARLLPGPDGLSRIGLAQLARARREGAGGLEDQAGDLIGDELAADARERQAPRGNGQAREPAGEAAEPPRRFNSGGRRHHQHHRYCAS